MVEIVNRNYVKLLKKKSGHDPLCYTVEKYKFPAGSEFDVVGNFRNTV